MAQAMNQSQNFGDIIKAATAVAGPTLAALRAPKCPPPKKPSKHTHNHGPLNVIDNSKDGWNIFSGMNQDQISDVLNRAGFCQPMGGMNQCMPMMGGFDMGMSMGYPGMYPYPSAF